MAKASQADMEMAMKLCSALEALDRRFFPEGAEGDNDPEDFDRYDDEHCGMALRHVLDILERGSIGRVIWGMYVLLDPANKVVDPDADTLEPHPEIEAAERYRGLLLWTLYHHQGGSSDIGQPIRRALGIGQHDHLTAEQIAEAKAAAGVTSNLN